MRRKEMLFGVIGGVVGAVLVMAVGSIAPLGAQNEVKDVTFGSVICTGISVGSSDRGESIWITPGEIHMMTPEGHGVLIYAAKGSGTLNLGQGVRINGGSKEGGGSISVIGEHGSVGMNITEHGGRVGVHGKGNDQSRVVIGVNEYGNGAVSTWDKNGYRLATLK